MSERSLQKTVKNPKRRLMLTMGVTGVVAFILGKIFGDRDNYLLPDSLQGPVKETRFSHFTLTEKEDEIILTEKDGEPIFVIDKESFK